ncbi:metal transporter [Jeotgalibacillus soli]|uniref:Magnesium transport protein CorA n=1 Tax=Jeotgalibacillus soli TaxID=889306 RepID=A0A0C2R359_9BACL|nr:metal transporter [Jeotgalibacillus soli]
MQHDGHIVQNVPLRDIAKNGYHWYWIDFDEPTKREEKELTRFFRFHPLAVEDCLENSHQRPKMDNYGHYIFLLVHALNKGTFDPLELDLFVNERMLVTFHYNSLVSVNQVWNIIGAGGQTIRYDDPVSIVHMIIDTIVDEYFPFVYEIEDRLNQIEEKTDENSSRSLMDELFDVRHDMQKLRRSLMPMRDLLYRVLNSNRISFAKEQQHYFQDVYDHVMKLVEMLESYREFSSDVRDNYISISSDKMNNIMMTLTVITTIFMPLTFIAGLYGMNFIYMPELRHPYAYFIVLAIMAAIAFTMFMVFKKIGWLTFSRSKKKKRRRIFLSKKFMK